MIVRVAIVICVNWWYNELQYYVHVRKQKLISEMLRTYASQMQCDATMHLYCMKRYTYVDGLKSAEEDLQLTE